MHENKVDGSRLKTRRSSIKHFVNKFRMGAMRPSEVDCTIQVLDADKVKLSKQRGAVKKYSRKEFNPYCMDADWEEDGDGENKEEVDEGDDYIVEDDVWEPKSQEELQKWLESCHWAITTTNIKVVVFPADQCLKHLILGRRDLMQPGNLVINREGFPNPDPWAMYDDGTGILGELLTGQWYKNAYTYHKINPSTHFLCPLILFIDKTITEFMGRYGLTPVVATLAIFNESTRHNPTAWIPLGFLPDVTKYKSKAQMSKERNYIKGIHQQNHHRCLEHILEPLRQIQQQGGLSLNASLTGEIKDNVWKTWVFPIACILGDTQGHDTMAGRYVYYGTDAGRINRACNCPGDKSDDPNWECKFVTQQQIMDLMRGSQNDRKAWSQHHLKMPGMEWILEETPMVYMAAPPQTSCMSFCMAFMYMSWKHFSRNVGHMWLLCWTTLSLKLATCQGAVGGKITIECTLGRVSPTSPKPLPLKTVVP